jgi:hypothetical protein
MTWFARWAAVDFGLVIGPKLTDVQLYNWQVLEQRRETKTNYLNLTLFEASPLLPSLSQLLPLL